MSAPDDIVAHYPQPPVDVGHTEPVPRRIRAVFGGTTVVDTVRAVYVWEHPFFPQFHIPAADVDESALAAAGREEDTDRGRVQILDLVAGGGTAPGAARYLESSVIPGLDCTYRFEWGAMDAWFEEVEQVFGHPRNPYVRVDAVRSSRHVRVELGGVVLAESTAPVAVFETGLPTRWYLDRTAVHWDHLLASPTRTRCPYKGVTSAYWSADMGGTAVDDVAWCYDFPAREVLPIAGLVCFYQEKVDVFVDGARQVSGRS